MTRMLAGRTAIVTGAARGIGASIALEFARQGANVVLNARSDSTALKDMVVAVEALGVGAVASVGNVADAAYAPTLTALALERFGTLDILVNNAGVIKDRPLSFLKEADWDEVVDTNLKGAFLCTKAAIKPMVHQRAGRIINIASISALSGRPGQTHYGAAKAGLIGFTRSLARETARYNVLANAAVLGVIDTRMTRQIPRDTLQEIAALVPLGRIGQPEEVAKVCLFLASDMSSYVTGTTINVSGGGYI